MVDGKKVAEIERRLESELRRGEDKLQRFPPYYT